MVPTFQEHRWQKHFDRRGVNSSRGIDLFMNECTQRKIKINFFIYIRGVTSSLAKSGGGCAPLPKKVIKKNNLLPSAPLWYSSPAVYQDESELTKTL